MQCSTNLMNWLRVYHTIGMTPQKFTQLLHLQPDLNDLPAGLRVKQDAIDRDLTWLQQHSNAAIIPLNSPYYPERLRQIATAPPLLYVQGNYKALQKLQLAIVGSRTPSATGLQLAAKFAAELVKYNLVITSGMALGIDGASHKGALQAGGETIAIWGSGLDIIYPRQHSMLAKQIIEQGCIVSEFPIGTQPAPYNFPQRNRIISGLSLGVLVVEAAQKSGSLITADFALEHGREIFAIPGSINNAKVKGCHELIRRGAKLVDSVTDVMNELTHLLQFDFRGRNADSDLNGVKKSQLSRMQEILLEQIGFDATCVDLIVGRTGLATSVVGSILLELELMGLVAAVPGGYARMA